MFYLLLHYNIILPLGKYLENGHFENKPFIYSSVPRVSLVLDLVRLRPS